MSDPLRSMTFVPAYNTRFLDKAITFTSDALILDLEDAVPWDYKQQARDNLRSYLDAGSFSQAVYVRVNAIDTGLLLKDLEAALHPRTSGIMFTKIRDERDIVYLDKLLSQLESDLGFEEGTFTMCPLIETASAVMRAYEIATASPRMIALTFGAEDYLRELDGLHLEHGASLLVPRSMIVMAARAAGIEPIDTPYLDIRNLAGLERELLLARELGFSGSLLLHPSHIQAANAVFAPSEAEIAEARSIIDAIEASAATGSGVALIDGKLVGPPMEKRARAVLAKAGLER